MTDEAQCPPPPEDLKPEAQARWRQVIPDLIGRGPVDLELLKSYCQVFARWRQAEDGIAKTGTLVTKPRGGVGANPLIAISNQAGAQARALEAKLGIARETTVAPLGVPISLRAYGKRRGVSGEAVSRAIKSGRLARSVTYVGNTPKIADQELADQEWEANTDSTRRGDDEGEWSGAAAREKHWRAELAEMTFRKRAGELVDAVATQAAFVELCTELRNKFLGLTNTIKQEHPETPREWLATLDRKVREHLEEIAAS